MTWEAGTAPWDANSAAVETRVSCRNVDGSIFEVSATQQEDGNVLMPSCSASPSAQPGAVGRCVTLFAGQTAGSLVEQSSNCGSVQQLEATYPNCVGPGSTACTYVVRVDGRDEVRAALAEEGIESQIGTYALNRLSAGASETSIT